MGVCTITVVGNLGGAPESREAGTGKVCSFSVAHNRRTKNEDTTDWYNVEAWGRLGEVCQQYLDKGSSVVVTGGLAQRKYTTKDGREGISMDIRANEVQFVGGKSEKQEAPAAAPDEDAEDIPF